jgi:hypothetical protein
MALRFMDGFDYTNASGVHQDKWDSDSDQSWTPRAGRFGGNAISRNGNAPLNKTLDAQSTWIVGQAVRPPIGSSSGQLLEFDDAGTVQVRIYISNSTDIEVYRGAGTTLLGSASNVLANLEWRHLEVKVVINNTTGSVEIRVDGTTVINLTNQDTQVTGNATANKIIFNFGASNLYHDDFYILDGTGTTNNNFLGDVRVETLLPSGNGNSSQFTGSDGNSTDNYLLVDDSPAPDDDTTYVESATLNDIDLYAIADLGNSPDTIYGVAQNSYSRKTDVGSRGLINVVRSGGTNYDGTNELDLLAEYKQVQEILETDPDTAVAWVTSGVNNMESGFKVST